MNSDDEKEREEFFKALSEHISRVEREVAKMLFLAHNPHVQVLESKNYELIVCTFKCHNTILCITKPRINNLN
jgi:hypothetical protein